MNKKRATLIIAHSRPRYLWVCLKAITNAYNYYKDIYVAIDYSEKQKEMINVCKEFNVIPIVRNENYFTLKNTLEGLKEVFDKGYEGVFHVEEDVLISKLAFNWLNEVVDLKKDKLVYGLRGSSKEGKLFFFYFSGATFWNKNLFQNLYKFYKDKKYCGKEVGRKWGGMKIKILDENEKSHDKIVRVWMQEYNIKTKVPGNVLALHFGVTGTHWNENSIAKEMFSGVKDEWISNVLEAYSKYPVQFESAHSKEGFKYD